MHRYCKNVDITDRDLISIAVKDCLRGKWKRNDVLCLLKNHDPLRRTFKELRDAIIYYGPASMDWVVEDIINTIIAELRNKNIQFRPIWYTTRFDNSCHKDREIGIQDIKQQIYDYVAVYSMHDVFRRIGEYQCASLPTKGQSYGVKAIRKWLRNPKIKYACKADVRKCFPSISRENMMAFLRKYIANDDILWLVDLLLGTFKTGLSIGSYLSQYLCNLYMSQLYHYIAEDLYHERKKKNGAVERENLVSHVLFYMDDILLLGTSAKHMHMAMKRIIAKARDDMGLTIKPDWRVWKMNDTAFIDIMGVRIYRHHITIRSGIFIRVRRTLKHAQKMLDTHAGLTKNNASKVIAYFGLLRHTNSFRIAKKFQLFRSVAFAKRRLRNVNEGKIF